MKKEFAIVLVFFCLGISKPVFSQFEIGAGIENTKLNYNVDGRTGFIGSYSLFVDYALDTGSELEAKLTKDLMSDYAGYSIIFGWHRNFWKKVYSIIRFTYHSNSQVEALSYIFVFKNNVLFLGGGVGVEVRKEVYLDLVFNLPLERRKWVIVSVPSGRAARYLESMIKLTFRIGWSL